MPLDYKDDVVNINENLNNENSSVNSINLSENDLNKDLLNDESSNVNSSSIDNSRVNDSSENDSSENDSSENDSSENDSSSDGYQDRENNKNYDVIETIIAYEAFVQLITKHKFSDSTTNDIIKLFNDFHMDPAATLPTNAKSVRVLLNLIQVSHILYRKTIVMEYNQIQYTLYHRTIFDTIKELLSNVDIFKYCVFNYVPKYITNQKNEKERCYSELYNGN
ncbi:hypothetical protein GLOIN_2v1486686 [Rhizophagus clarus]|uniref:Uncharacterized protein n=1 Tax=Rhizophagus clarus TaxID=94130 RepID=A0A8H3QJF6_9GLOM|nr:hypothetical protein GLOIN_2v1486686 [Rhizophagus clarus]